MKRKIQQLEQLHIIPDTVAKTNADYRSQTCTSNNSYCLCFQLSPTLSNWNRLQISRVTYTVI